MQYKIPIQIENEDTIVAWLSLRQLAIMMGWWWVAYGVFTKLNTSIGETPALVIGIIIACIGILIALVRVSEMTFLPTILSFLRLTLNEKSRIWSVGADSYSDLEIGYLVLTSEKSKAESNKSLETRIGEDARVNEEILKL